MTTLKPRVGVSSCLLGQLVRYNGDHKKMDWVADSLQKHVEVTGICPEVAMGLGVPRPALRLIAGEKKDDAPRLVVSNTGEDLTEKALLTTEKLARVAPELDGFILKKDSPSCGIDRVKVYGKSGIPERKASGLFAAALRRAAPDLPMIEEGRLGDLPQRENFLIRLFAYARLKRIQPTMREVQEFHRRQKLLILEHSPKLYLELGRIVGNPERLAPAEVLTRYRSLFMEALECFPTARTRTNVLEHALGFLRGKADEADRAQLSETIHLYRKGDLPFIAPLTVASHLIRKLKISYLEEQAFFAPYPRALGAHFRL